MDYASFLRQSLYLQGLPIYEADLPYIHHILYTINEAEAPLKAFPELNVEVPITIVDKELML
ncbi:hypothetical protein J2Z83_002598 [Virgibacillus natechei]|uniref:Uncharacterized protein n=1 Tax=Virgibacillus natechei TaxID=1216297 RepID=A0ABS4IHQ2_9BACI|nr:hypothetical protein [Virgibacillus natechei]MBP1970477.1 hypothetical protein [Virgibacillus natechei]UZD13874.1 hypothetical protein OLD84_04880 [Virgibacillus natechei]